MSMTPVMWLALFSFLLALAMLLIEPRSVLQADEKRALSVRTEELLDQAPFIGEYRRNRKKTTIRATLENYRGTFWADVAMYLTSEGTFEDALREAGASTPEHHPWRRLVQEARTEATERRGFPETLKDKLYAYGADKAAQDLAALVDLATESSCSNEEVAGVAEALAKSANEDAWNKAMERVKGLPVKMLVVNVVCFLPVLIVVSVGDVAWEFMITVGGMFK